MLGKHVVRFIIVMKVNEILRKGMDVHVTDVDNEDIFPVSVYLSEIFLL
jgi:hypothetical protein